MANRIESSDDINTKNGSNAEAQFYLMASSVEISITDAIRTAKDFMSKPYLAIDLDALALNHVMTAEKLVEVYKAGYMTPKPEWINEIALVRQMIANYKEERRN